MIINCIIIITIMMIIIIIFIVIFIVIIIRAAASVYADYAAARDKQKALQHDSSNQLL